MNPLGEARRHAEKYAGLEKDEKLDLIRLFEENIGQEDVPAALMDLLLRAREEWEKESLAAALMGSESGMNSVLDACKNSAPIREIFSSEPFPGILASMMYMKGASGDFDACQKLVHIMEASDPTRHIHSLLGALSFNNNEVAAAACSGIGKLPPGLAFNPVMEYIPAADNDNAARYLALFRDNPDDEFIVPLARMALSNIQREQIVNTLAGFDRGALDRMLSLKNPEFDPIRKDLKLVAPEERFDGPMPKVLIVEDSQAYSTLLKTMLVKAGFIESSTASNGGEGVNQARRYKPHIVLMDIVMPAANGFDNGMEAAEAILSENPKICLMFITSRSGETLISKAKLIGARDFLNKTITFAQLKEKLLDARKYVLESGFLF